MGLGFRVWVGGLVAAFDEAAAGELPGPAIPAPDRDADRHRGFGKHETRWGDWGTVWEQGLGKHQG